MPLPPGLLLNPQTGELTGTPTVAGVYSIALKVRDTLGTTRELVDEVVINSYTPMAWSGDLGHLMVNRAPPGVTAAVANGLAPYAFTVYSGALPDGLVLDAGTGAITGTCTTAGGYAVVLRCTDSVGGQADYVLAGTVADELLMVYGGDGRGTVGVIEDETLGVSGGTAPYSYAVVDALPAGLAFDAARVHGTPTAASAITSTLRVTDAYGFVTDTAIIWDIVAHTALASLSSHGTVGTAFSGTLSASGGHAPYTFAWSKPNPTNGLSLDAGTGVLAGTPVSASAVNATTTVTDDLGVVSSGTIAVDIHAAVAISGSYATSVSRTSSYSFAPSVSGGWPAYTFSISVGALPTGLSLNTATGVISGTCTTQGAFTATLRVADSDGNAATMAFNVTVAGDLSLTGAVTNFATTGVAYNGSTLAGSGGATPYVFSIAAGALPAGLSLNTATGAITGTPTGSNGNGVTSNFTVRVTDANTSWAQSAFSITVANAPTLTGTAPDGSTGAAYSYAYAISGGFLPLTYAVATGVLPTGLSLNASTGVISGTPSATGTFNFAIRVTDNHGNAFTHASDTVVVYATPVLSGTMTNHAELTAAYSSGLTASAVGKTPYNWSVQGTIPPGTSFSASTGVLSGTPTAAGTYNFTVVVTDALSHSASSAQSVVVAAAVNFVSGYATGGTVGQPYDNVAPTVSGGWTALTYALASGTLPGGTSLNTSTGVISGTLTGHGTWNFSIRVTDSLGVADTLSRTVTVNNAVSLSGSAGAGTVGVAYGFTPTTSGGWGPFAYSISAGSLPPGLSLNSSTGAITGTPTTAGTYTPTVRCLDTATYGGSSDTLALSIVVTGPPVLSTSYPRGEVSFAYSGSASVSGGHSPFTYSKASGTLPAGVSLNTSTGALSGTPTTAATNSFTIRVTDALGNTDTQSSSVIIAAAVGTTTDFPDGRVGVAFSAQAGSAGGWTPKTFSVASGGLPTGLSLSGAGALTGTPSAAGSFSWVLRVTDGDGHAATRSQVQVIAAATAALSASASPNPAQRTFSSSGAVVAGSVSSSVTAAGGTAPYSYAWAFRSATDVTGASSAAFTISHSTPNAITGSHSSDGSPEYDRIEVWRCTVTDSASNTTFVDVSLELDITGTQ